MPILTLHRGQRFKLPVPFWVFLNEQPVGIMRGEKVSLQMPEGQFDVSLRVLLRIFKWQFHIGGTKRVDLAGEEHVLLTIRDKERWWNVLFNIDLVLWLAKMFFELPHPWSTVYEIVSNGFFIVWMARIWIIRNRYFQMVEQKTANQTK